MCNCLTVHSFSLFPLVNMFYTEVFRLLICSLTNVLTPADIHYLVPRSFDGPGRGQGINDKHHRSSPRLRFPYATTTSGTYWPFSHSFSLPPFCLCPLLRSSLLPSSLPSSNPPEGWPKVSYPQALRSPLHVLVLRSHLRPFMYAPSCVSALARRKLARHTLTHYQRLPALRLPE